MKGKKSGSDMPNLFNSALLSAALAQVGAATVSGGAEATYKTKYYNQTLDHVNNFDPSHPKWSHRYLLNDDNWGTKELSNKCPGPILMYTGNEADVTGNVLTSEGLSSPLLQYF